MEEQNQVKKQGNFKTILLFIVIILLAAAVGFLIMKLNKQVEETEVKIKEVAQITKENAIIEGELRAMFFQYDSLKTDNDSINGFLLEEQDRIQQLIKNINSNKAQIRSYKKELKTVRTVLKSYVNQIDSLAQKNEVLLAENVEVKKQYNKVVAEKSTLQNKNKTLEDKVEQAATLSAQNMSIEILKKRGRKTKYASKVEKLRINFQLLENAIAKSGEVIVYARIARPDDMVMAHSEDNLFEFEDKEIVYSAKRSIDYFNQTMGSEIFYENREEMIPGTYHVDLFSDGKIIGTGSFTLK